MAEHQRTNQDNKGNSSQKKPDSKGISKSPQNQAEALDQSIDLVGLELGMDEHASLLAEANNDRQRANLTGQLQRSYGNAYVQNLINSKAVQAKLEVSQPDDPYEQEADRVADTVSRSIASGIQLQASEEEEEESIQAKVDSTVQPQVDDRIENRINAARGSGESLDESTRSLIEPHIGHDFTNVKIHTGSEANTLSRQLGARAFTTGNDIFFRDGDYQPHSDPGRKLIAHELTHVVQQHSAPGVQRGIAIEDFEQIETPQAGTSAPAEQTAQAPASQQVETRETPAPAAQTPGSPNAAEQQVSSTEARAQTPAGQQVETRETPGAAAQAPGSPGAAVPAPAQDARLSALQSLWDSMVVGKVSAGYTAMSQGRPDPRSALRSLNEAQQFVSSLRPSYSSNPLAVARLNTLNQRLIGLCTGLGAQVGLTHSPSDLADGLNPSGVMGEYMSQARENL
jgi:hypothetical protein